ncbi:uncharacterized protein LOC117133652 [Brassica rapa]|uniref:uncharacterized protein LOC117133652 n=1 Tax=Brassica campestris TaxID=3711 RepID=UPI00142DEC37|nr:uncharacterized protein LOC117133652 [Brassica rapa]XP_048633995.1 uncharacterized protein LOC106445656 [Brassica napus]
MASPDLESIPPPSSSIPARSSSIPSLSNPNSNPLYVHNADHAGISLVSEKLTGLGNFNSWRRSMLLALGARNKAVFVTGLYPDLDESHPDFGSWSRCNNIVCTWIVNAVDKSIAKSIMYLDTARQMWQDIHDQFKQSDGPRTAEIKQQIYAETQGSQSVSEYYTRLKQLWEELKNHEDPYTCCCGHLDCASHKQLATKDEQDRVLKFLMGLNDSFTATRGQILMMEPKPLLAKVFNIVSQEERQRSMKSTSGVAFQASQMTSSPDSVVAAYAGGYNKQRPRPICSHCGLAGHTVNRCYKLHGYPQGYKASNSSYKGQNQSQPKPTGGSQQWNKNTNVANMVAQDLGSISMHDQQGTHLETVTTEQVQHLLSVLKANSNSKENNHSQISGSTI